MIELVQKNLGDNLVGIHEALCAATEQNQKGVFIIELSHKREKHDLHYLVKSIEFIEVSKFNSNGRIWQLDRHNFRLSIEEAINLYKSNSWIVVAYILRNEIVDWDTISRYQPGNLICSIMKLK